MLRTLRISALVLAVAFLLPNLVQAKEEAPPAKPEDVMKIILSHKELEKFASLVNEADLKELFKNKGDKITVFAPTNDAMAKIPSAVMKRARADDKNLQNLVKNHTILGSFVFTTGIKGRKATPSSGGGDVLQFDGTGADLKVGSGKIIKPNLLAMNGVVHIVDAPLVPASLKDEPAKVEEKAEEPVPMPKGAPEAAPAPATPDKAAAPTAPAAVPSTAAPAPEAPKPEEKKKWKIFGW